MATLRIKAEKLGTVSEVKSFLEDIESAYNGLYAFEFIVDTLHQEFLRHQDFLRQGRYPGDKRVISKLDAYFDWIIDDPVLWHRGRLHNLVELRSRIDIPKIVLPGDELTISKINIQSPGWWEFFGKFNPLEQLREYLKDRHERKKDKDYRNRQEEMKGDLDIMEKQHDLVRKKIALLKEMGYTDIEIRPLLADLVTRPLRRLDAHQATGLIDAPTDSDNLTTDY